MKVLLTNDDGVYAPGLWEVYDRLSGLHDVVVVAPDRERSAVGHGITLETPLRTRLLEIRNGYKGYSVNGTPADCIKLALLEILDHKPDMVISGINPGANVGVNINYSGTVAAAREAAFYGIPAMAVSIKGPGVKQYRFAAEFIESLVNKLAHNRMPFGTILNVNIPNKPPEQISGVRISRLGIRRLSEYFEKRIDPRNNEYYWPGADSQSFDNSPEIDGHALNENWISISPLKCDTTDYSFLETLKTWGVGA